MRHDEILNGTITDLDIGDGEITGADIGGELDASELRDDAFYRGTQEEVTFDDTDGARDGDYGLEEEAADCSTGTQDGELVSADVKWANVSPNEDELFISEIRLNMATDTATVLGGTTPGTTAPCRWRRSA